MSLNPLEWVGRLFSTADKAMDIAKEAVTDKDKANELIAHLEELKTTTMYIAELETKTVPWIDGLHKMGRQILNVLVIIAVVLLMLTGHTITPEVAVILGGPNVAYQLIKGKGK